MEKKSEILIVTPYIAFPEEPGFNRFITIANMLTQNYSVTLVTSSFSHFQKKHRQKEPTLENVNVVLLHEPGYKLNVGLGRVFSHKIFCEKFKAYLKSNGDKFDLIYSAYPLIYTNHILGKYKDKLKYKLIIDVQDIWPESITGSIPFLGTRAGKLILTPISKYANNTYSYADGLVAVSETYLNRANILKLNDDKTVVAYIGIPNIPIKNEYSPYADSDKPLIATYLGTLGGSYDLSTVIKAAALCKDEVQIQIIGSGPQEKSLKLLNESLGSNVQFLGTFSYQEAIKALSKSHLALNPIKPTAMQSVTNKLSDYLSYGLPVLSCQTNEEVKKLLKQGNNLSYQAFDHKHLANKLIYLNRNRDLLQDISHNNYKISQRKFLRSESYKQIVSLVERLI